MSNFSFERYFGKNTEKMNHLNKENNKQKISKHCDNTEGEIINKIHRCTQGGEIINSSVKVDMCYPNFKFDKSTR